jgi:hypothetical protein
MKKYKFKDYKTNNIYIFDSHKFLKEYLEDRYETLNTKVVCCGNNDDFAKIKVGLSNIKETSPNIIVGEFWIS